MSQRLDAALYGNQPPERPRKSRALWWILGGVVAGVVICLALALLAPFAYLTLSKRIQAPGSLSHLEPLACPGAVARDTVPTDVSGQFTVQPFYRETLVYAGDSRTAPASQRADLWA